jgi:2-keto-4-pentenoate hydratase
VELLRRGYAIDRHVAGAAMVIRSRAFAWLANLLAARGGGMQAGKIVITGSALRTRFPEPGDAPSDLGQVGIR